jgi:lipid II:glycine glycyltransferase (peptidoglycan interpeptide bridge formation enzyme)
MLYAFLSAFQDAFTGVYLTLALIMDNRLMLITDLLIQKLNDEIRYWQQKALFASEAANKEECRKALNAQNDAIDALIKLIEANKSK